MSSLANIFNEVAVHKELRGLETLVEGTKYKIIHLKRMNTKFGPRILVEFEEFNIFLGQRFNKISDEDLQKANDHAKAASVYIQSNGKVGSAINIQFIFDDVKA